MWYLSAWAGHFILQKDVPAVFSYGMSPRGWAVGEYCSMRALYGWGERGLVTIPEPWQWAATAATMAVWFVACGISVAPKGKGHKSAEKFVGKKIV